MDAGIPGPSGNDSVGRRSRTKRRFPKKVEPTVLYSSNSDEESRGTRSDLFNPENDVPLESPTKKRNLFPFQNSMGYISSNGASNKPTVFSIEEFEQNLANPLSSSNRRVEITASDVESDYCMDINEAKGYIIWRPVKPHLIASNLRDSRIFKKIWSTVHLDEFFQTRTKCEFIPKPIDENCKTSIPGLTGMWFRIDNKSSHNRYGNVNFGLNIAAILHLFERAKRVLQFYFYEIYQSSTQCISRFIVTEHGSNLPPHLVPFDRNIPGGPWYAEQNMSGITLHTHPTAIRSFRSEGLHHAIHQVEFFFNFREPRWRELFIFAQFTVSDHRKANASKKNGCQKYSSDICDEQSKCPFPLTKAETLDEAEEDWRIENFSTITEKLIRRRTLRRLILLNCSKDIATLFCHKMKSKLVNATNRKAREMCSLVIGNTADDDFNQQLLDYEKVMKKSKKGRTKTYTETVRVLFACHDSYLVKLMNSGLDEKSLSSMSASGRMEVDIAQMVESLVFGLFELVQFTISDLAVEMEVVLSRCRNEDILVTNGSPVSDVGIP